MINKKAIINAPASHKTSPNSPSHKAQKASRRHTRSQIQKQKQFCALPLFLQGFINNCEWSEEINLCLSPRITAIIHGTYITGRRL